METQTIEIPTPIISSIKKIVDDTKLFVDEEDFINQAILKQITKFKPN